MNRERDKAGIEGPKGRRHGVEIIAGWRSEMSERGGAGGDVEFRMDNPRLLPYYKLKLADKI
eukprot:767597-Hanusia_phi.AAC.8